MSVATLDVLPDREAAAALERCCGSALWVELMLAARPWVDAGALHGAAERAFDALGPADWREAFAHHPRIGDLASLERRFATTAAWAGAEQGGAAGADRATLEALAEGNRRYEERFGHLFIVCATGLSAAEMLARLEARIDNDAATELANAAAEQRRITALRLDRLVEEGA